MENSMNSHFWVSIKGRDEGVSDCCTNNVKAENYNFIMV